MTFLTKLRAEIDTSPASDFWFNPVSQVSTAGVTVTPETALTVSTVWACRKAISEDLAALPLSVFEDLDPGKKRALNHPLYDVLHDSPNARQTSVEWLADMIGYLLMWGNGYNRIIEGPRGFADQLEPLHPARMEKVELLDTGRLRYTYRQPDGRQKIYNQDEIFHIRGPSDDGIVGMSVVRLARESFGLGMATEQFGARLFSQGAVQRGMLTHPGKLTPTAQKQLKEQWNSKVAGLNNAHGTVVLEEGMKWEQVGMTNEDSQFLGTRGFQVEEIARWFGVPLSRIQHTEKATTWGTGIEQMQIGYVIHTLLPWAVRIEQAIRRDLIIVPQKFFVKFNFDALLRGDQKTRYESYRNAITTGWMDRNEARQLEDMNPREGLSELLVPQNMATLDEDGNITPVNDTQAGTGDPPGLNRNSRAHLLATELAGIVVRREVQAVGKAIKKYGDDEPGLHGYIEDFYDRHAEFVAKNLRVNIEDARRYTWEQHEAILNDGPESIEANANQRIADLAELALMEGEQDE